MEVELTPKARHSKDTKEHLLTWEETSVLGQDDGAQALPKGETQISFCLLVMACNFLCLMYCMMNVCGKVLMNGYGVTIIEWSCCR